MTLSPVTAGDGLPPRARWAAGRAFRLPEPLARRVSAEAPGWNAAASELAEAAADDLRLRAAFIAKPPVATTLPISYRSIPGPLRRFLARQVGRRQRRRQGAWADFPGWPLDLSADLAADLAGRPRIAHPRTPVLLSHDLDSGEGLENFTGMFIDIEEAVGARSANYIVPCAWALDHGRLAEVAARGHEIGIHGYDHSNRTAFSAPEERRRRIAAGRELAERYGAGGYRSPSLMRTPGLIEDLAPFYRYDSSIPCSGGPFPAPNNGCATARPWKLGAIWEIPLTLARDGSLRFLGHSPEEILSLWQDSADLVARSGGIVSVLTHCEAGFSGNPEMLSIYRRFVEWIAADKRFEFMLPRDLLDRIEAVERSGAAERGRARADRGTDFELLSS